MMPFPQAKAAGKNRLDAAASGKQPQSEVHYREAEAPDQACGACLHFDGDKMCDVVEGEVNAAGVSDLFEPAAPVPAATAPAVGP